MTSLKTWFDTRSLREKRLIVAMLGLFAVTLLWAGIIRPIGDGLSSSRERYADAVIRVGTTEAQVDALRSAQRRRVPALGAPLADAIRARAEAAGFALATLDPDGADRIRISIANAKPQALFGWVAELEAGGILVDGLSVSNNGDQTVAAQMTLKARPA